jgi:hypothetical protein
LSDWLSQLGLDWAAFKVFFAHASGVSHDAMHVIAGVLAQLIIAAVLRKSVASPWPWIAVLLAELVNEWNDLQVERWPEVAMQYGEIAKDIGLTMLLPTVLLITARWWPGLVARR